MQRNGEEENTVLVTNDVNEDVLWNTSIITFLRTIVMPKAR